MLIFTGGSALSTFRQARLLERIQQQAPEVQGLEARHVYLVHERASLNQAAQDRLGQLLEARPGNSAPGPPARR